MALLCLIATLNICLENITLHHNKLVLGFILDVENFDKWLDDDTLMNKYQNSSSFRDKQQRDNQAQLTQTVDMLAKAMLEDREQRRKEEAKKNHSWFGNLFHRN